jgi:hypothetical protein
LFLTLIVTGVDDLLGILASLEGGGIPTPPYLKI